jgi:hypothetical protein
MGRDLGRLRRMIERERRQEGSLSFHAEQKGPFAREAEALAAVLGCLLTDRLGPAADALERVRQEGLFAKPVEPEDEEKESE